MGTCISREDDVAADSGEDDVAADSRRSCPVMVTKDHFDDKLQDRSWSSYWVYARFTDKFNSESQCFYALDIKDKKYMHLPDHPMNSLVNTAASVLDHNLYVIGGKIGAYVSYDVHVFDPVLHAWYDTIVTRVSRRAALAASVDGKVYVFGGCDMQIGEWGEVYEPSTNTWTPIPRSQTLIHALDNGLSPLRASAVLGKNIILRGWLTGISFDVTTSSWSPVSDNLIENWYTCGRAAVVQNLLITCHSGLGQDGKHRLSIRAYDPDENLWLTIEGIDSSFHANAEKSDFMSVNGKLAIYHMRYKEHLVYSVFEIKERRVRERLRASVTANLLWQSIFPIGKMIKQGQHSSRGRRHKSLYKPSFVEALRGDDLKS